MPTVREHTQEIERMTLAPGAALSENSRGRLRPEEACPCAPATSATGTGSSTASPSVGSNKNAGVPFARRGDHYRTRLTHTLEVNQIARTIARALRLNEDLTEAIALGHDLGHALRPRGRAGAERFVPRRL